MQWRDWGGELYLLTQTFFQQFFMSVCGTMKTLIVFLFSLKGQPGTRGFPGFPVSLGHAVYVVDTVNDS